MKQSLLAAVIAGTCLAGLPTLAASPAATNGTASVNTTNNSADQPSQRNPILADNGQVRMSKLVGTDVYNDHDQKLGSVDDVLMGQNGQPDVIMKVKGKLVQVPWSRLQFGNAKENSDNKVIYPGATQDALNGEPEFQYRANRRG